MLDFLTFGTEKLQLFLLVSFRAAGLFIAAPIIGNNSVPQMVKVGLAIILAMIMVPVAGKSTILVVESVWVLAMLAFKEALVGFIIGLFFSLLFIGIRMAGNIIGFQIGLMIANIMDPETNSNVSLAGEFWFIVATLIFLVIDGHHAIISAFRDSYHLVPVGYFNFTGGAGEMLIHYSAYTFVIAIKLAAPVIITLFLTTVALGVVARTVPQMNIFIVGIPLKIGIGFLVMATALPIFRFMIVKMIHFLDSEVGILLHSIGTA
ncbi:MAG: flagellar biosynthetic protein FliR [Candidatus Zixiibacteriota bacterium]